jgi:hypothetical protein
MTSGHQVRTPEEIDAQLAKLRADPEEAARFGIELRQKIKNAFKELQKRPSRAETDPEWRRLIYAIRSQVEKQAGTQFGEDLHIWPTNPKWTYVIFDLWYQTDEQLSRDNESGRHRELTEICNRQRSSVRAQIRR